MDGSDSNLGLVRIFGMETGADEDQTMNLPVSRPALPAELQQI